MTRLIVGVCFLITAAQAQVPLVQWPEKLKAYYALHNPVKLHLHFNQPVYAPGDTVFLRAAYILAADAMPLKGFNLIQLDVVDANGTVILHQWMRLRDGWGANQLILPETMPPGNYRVIAYDNWMKNFDRSRYFEGELRVAGEYFFSDKPVKKPLTCYPEGGRLVAGLRNKVVVAAAANEKGTVSDERGNKLADFSTDSNGYGLFFIDPEKDKAYTVQSGSTVCKLTAADDGVVILVTPSVTANTSNRILIQVPATSALRSEPLNLIISGHGAVYYSASFTFDEKEFISLSVPVAALPQGICYLTVNRSNAETLASRIFYNNRNNQVKATLLPEKKLYSTRSDVNVGLSITDGEGEPQLARMSVSVYQADIFPISEDLKNSTAHYFSWISDLNEMPPAGLEANLSATEGLLMLDRLLVTRSWPWYTWKDVLNKQEKPEFLFRDYRQVSGRLVETSTGKPFADSVSLTFYVMGTGDVYEVTSKNDGTFSISFLHPFYGKENIFYRVDRAGKRMEQVKAELTDSLSRYANVVQAPTQVVNPYFDYARKRKMVNTSFSYFSRRSNTTPVVENTNAFVEKELFKPDVEVDLDDYLIFPTMQETLHEIVPYLQYRKIAGRDVVRLYLPEKAQTGTENPAFFIDGVLTDDPAYFLNLKPVEVDKIKLVYSAYKLEKLGAISRNGVVLVETKIQDNAKKVLAATRSINVMGITPALPIPRGPASWQQLNPRTPQLKSWLAWIPHLRSDEQGKATFSFKTADDTGRFVIRVEGLTIEGIPFVHEEYLDVIYNREN